MITKIIYIIPIQMKNFQPGYLQVKNSLLNLYTNRNLWFNSKWAFQQRSAIDSTTRVLTSGYSLRLENGCKVEQ